jgi:chromosome segregation ATPase
MLNWRRDPDVERKIAESKMRAQQLRKEAEQIKSETEQIRSENALLNEKLRNFRDLELRLKQAAPSSPTVSKLPQPDAPSSNRP